MTLTNADLAELLARRADGSDNEHRARAYRRAARAALTWPEEAYALLEEGRSLQELHNIGPRLAVHLETWLNDPPADVEPAPARAGFLTMAEVNAVITRSPEWRTFLRGDLQMHTVYSDGADTIEAMAHAGAALGHSYVAITDHSKGLKIAGGMDEATLALQAQEIASANDILAGQGVDVRVLRGLEMNLNTAGEGDMEPASLAGVEFVIGSFHSALRRTEDQTSRYLAALDNPHVNVLGHPRGRIYNRRAGLHADWEIVIERAAQRGKALEMDCFPDRQDLQVEILDLARDAEVMFSIGTDAHNTAEMRFVDFGIAAAVIAGIPKERILNFRTADEVVAWARDVRGL